MLYRVHLHERGSNSQLDCIDSCKSNYHTATTSPQIYNICIWSVNINKCYLSELQKQVEKRAVRKISWSITQQLRRNVFFLFVPTIYVYCLIPQIQQIKKNCQIIHNQESFPSLSMVSFFPSALYCCWFSFLSFVLPETVICILDEKRKIYSYIFNIYCKYVMIS